MKVRNLTLICAALALGLSAASAYAVTPTVNSAVLITRVYDDCPFSTLTTGNTYPGDIFFDDVLGDSCGGFANLHVWRLSGDGSVPAIFPNDACFRIAADLMITGSGQAEAGLQVRPWWGEADGRLNVRSTDGEIACFGGRLPFYSFTGTFGLHYVKGTPIHVEIIYQPNGLSMASPATIVYNVVYNSVAYSSGPLAFDEGNGAEGYGTWGMLNNAQVGAHCQVLWNPPAPPGTQVRAEWTNIEFEDLCPPTPAEVTSWGQIKHRYTK